MPTSDTSVDIDTLCARFERLCRAIAPLDLGDTPLYIVPQSRVPDHLGGNSACVGFTSPSLDLYVKDVIGPAWRGRGGCMVVNDTEFGGQMDTLDVELAMSAVVLHELAHILERPTAYRDRHDAGVNRLAFEALCVGDVVAREAPPTEIATPFQGHEAMFIRIALHLRHRAEALGTLVPILGFCAGSQYGLSNPHCYREALGDEPDRLTGASIRDMRGIPPPEKFTRLWARDLAHWQSLVSSLSERSLTP